jgi:hypothetical protein
MGDSVQANCRGWHTKRGSVSSTNEQGGRKIMVSVCWRNIEGGTNNVVKNPRELCGSKK